ncbi:MAG: DUF503 domain-containing protein [Acidobacteriota bacterium]
MNVGLGILRLHLPGIASLKQKRQVLRSLKERLRGCHNVAIAEVDHQDLWQRATLGIVSVASARVPLERTFASIQDEVERRLPGEVLDFEVEYLS